VRRSLGWVIEVIGFNFYVLLTLDTITGVIGEMRKIHLYDFDKFIADQRVPGKRSSRFAYTDMLDLLMARADILTGRDKVLMKMYYEKGSTFGQIARLIRVNECTVARKIHKITHQLLDGEYIRCLRNSKHFSQKEQAIARDYYITGLSLDQISTKRGVTLYVIRKLLRKIRKLDKGK